MLHVRKVTKTFPLATSERKVNNYLNTHKAAGLSLPATQTGPGSLAGLGYWEEEAAGSRERREEREPLLGLERGQRRDNKRGNRQRRERRVKRGKERERREPLLGLERGERQRQREERECG